MNTYLTKAAFAVSVLILTMGCEKEPMADFSMSKSAAFTGDEINFTNATIGAYSYIWRFGDGESSVARNPSHIYKKKGSYDVSLTAFSENGNKSDVVVKSIKISQANEIVLGDIKSPLTQGIMIYHGSIWGPPYAYEIYLLGEGFTIVDDYFSGVGDLVHLMCWSPTETQMENGSYVWDLATLDFTFCEASIVINYHTDSGSGTLYDIDGGTVSFANGLNDYAFNMDLTCGAIPAMVYYTGNLSYFDESLSKTK
jgi:PKD repeat protein